MKGSRDCDVLVLDAMLNHVPVPLVTSNADYLVRKCQSMPTPALMKSLGKALVKCNTKDFENKEEIVNTCWNIMNEFSNLEDSLPCLAIWMEFVSIQFQDKEVNKLLG